MKKLPTIDLVGTIFTINLKVGELRNTESPFNSIPIRSLDLSQDGYTYSFWYDTNAKGLHLAPVDEKNIPTELIKLEIPNELKLDPVQLAISSGLKPEEFTKYFPVQNNLRAKIILKSGENKLMQRIQSLKQRIVNKISPQRKFKL